MDYELRLQHFYQGVLKPGMVAIDVGAHLGRHAFEMLGCVGPRGRVLMFEPIPDLYHKLVASVNEQYPHLGNSAVYPYALSNAKGTTEFCLAMDAMAYSGLKERQYDCPTRIQKISVEVRCLDDFTETLQQLDYIKIDTEGAEWNVIQGAQQSITRYKPIISFEFGQNSYAPYNVSPAQVFDFFVSKNYSIVDILGNTLDHLEFTESSVRQQLWDYIAVPNERSDCKSYLRHSTDSVDK